jgi:hypothetical protein
VTRNRVIRRAVPPVLATAAQRSALESETEQALRKFATDCDVTVEPSEDGRYLWTFTPREVLTP